MTMMENGWMIVQNGVRILDSALIAVATLANRYLTT